MLFEVLVQKVFIGYSRKCSQIVKFVLLVVELIGFYVWSIFTSFNEMYCYFGVIKLNGARKLLNNQPVFLQVTVRRQSNN